MEMALLIGIPAAGKSTFFERCLAATHARVNLDTLKRRPRELRRVRDCIAAGRDFAVDNTNVLASDRARYVPLAKAAGYRVKGYVFDGPLEDAMRRNAGRTGAARVPPRVVHAYHAKFEPPAWSEGFDELCRVAVAGGGFVVEPLPRP